jgi:ATP synthase mitochondrial F1 complex assembly factor 2
MFSQFISRVVLSSLAGAEQTLKRFWKTVGVETRDVAGSSSYVVTLDKRPLKTPSGKTLALPHSKHLAATLIATEWENQDKVLKAHALPMVFFFFCLLSFGLF